MRPTICLIMLTRNGICYKLEVSPYRITINELTLYFSSVRHTQKFTDEWENYVNKINDSLTKRFKLKFDLFYSPIIICYSKIETRGFYIKFKGVHIKCLDDIIIKQENVIKN